MNEEWLDSIVFGLFILTLLTIGFILNKIEKRKFKIIEERKELGLPEDLK